MTISDEAPARFDEEAERRSILRKVLDRYNVPFAWGVSASYVFYLSAIFVMPSLIAEKLLVGIVTAVGLLAVIISAVVHRRT